MGYKRWMFTSIKYLVTPIFKLIYRTKYINAHNVPKEGAYIFAGNHISSVDPIIMAIGQRHRNIHFMAKSELFKNPVLRWFFLSIGAFPVDRGNSDKGAVKHFEQILDDGELMGIFIEGTRSKTGEFLKPKSGAALIAYDTKTPVIPVCQTKINGRRVCHFGEPMSLKDLGFENGGAREYREASRRIMDKLKEFREQDINESNRS
ncbi:MAG: 1-acyl-sn-glycerol-3-phosphate acyltransferase [Ruminococcus sp.]|nr:1-acyl-sn-glycerol-3-phosphate acyltransferase [Ruminococcus sp.]